MGCRGGWLAIVCCLIAGGACGDSDFLEIAASEAGGPPSAMDARADLPPDLPPDGGIETRLDGVSPMPDAAVVLPDAAGAEFCGADPGSLEAGVRELLRQMNIGVSVQIRLQLVELEVPGLCDALGFRLVEVRFLNADGLEGSRNVFLYGRGLLRELAGEDLWGLTVDSGVMFRGELYFTFGWGSGYWRSQISKIAVVDGHIVQQWSPSFSQGGSPAWRLFVRLEQDRVAVDGGPGEVEWWTLQFNVWSHARLLGFVRSDDSGPLGLKIVDAAGQEIRSIPP
jgi:hypothetical protein